MTSQKKEGGPISIKEMFRTISGKYDIMNSLISIGQDQAWRSYVVKMASPLEGGRLLDIGAGTGNIARLVLQRNPGARVVAADFSLEMMLAGKGRGGNNRLTWCSADAIKLPFPDCTFDAVTSGYLLRNVSNPSEALLEQLRVVKPGGKIVCLDTSPPERNLLWPMIMFHMKFIIPLLGQLVAGNKTAYEYLPGSTQAFMTPKELQLLFKKLGLQRVIYKRFMLGTQVVISGKKPLRK